MTELPSKPCRVAVAIPTYRRPEPLMRLLGILGERASELPDGYEVTAIVVDNDPDASARSLVTGQSFGVPVRYAHEPTPGIAAARSRLLAEAAHHQLLVFIDDDEWPLEGWLRELVLMWEQTRAAAVMGAVLTVLPDDTDPWVVALGIFERPHRTPGQALPAAATGNLLLDLHQVRTLGIDFDTSLGLRGGEDSLFTRQLRAGGGRIVACPDSMALDEPGDARMTREFVLRRARFHGITRADIDLRMATSRTARILSRLRSTAKAGVWLLRGLVLTIRGALSSSLRAQARSVRANQRGIGLLQGAWTKPQGEYERSTQADKTVRRGTAGIKDRIRRASPFLRSLVGVTTAEEVAVLTLDDGPDEHWTPLILDLLRDRGATATFFVLLTRTRRHPELLSRILEEGHEVGLHGVDHRRITTMSVRYLAEQLSNGRRELEAAAGTPVRWYRPPYGAMTPLRWWVVRRSGLTPVLWSNTALDGRDATLEERRDSAKSVAAGDILLAHDSRAGRQDGAEDPEIADFDRVALIRAILDAWASRNLRAVSLEKALRAGVPRQAMLISDGQQKHL